MNHAQDRRLNSMRYRLLDKIGSGSKKEDSGLETFRSSHNHGGDQYDTEYDLYTIAESSCISSP